MVGESSLTTINTTSAIKQKSVQDIKVQILAEQLGYKTIPVDILTFCKDPYYLGNAVGINPETGDWILYKIWRDRLQEVFPTPVTVKSYLSVNGCIGSGKTTFSKICLLYTLYKVLCLKNPYATFKLAPKFICFAVFNMTKDKAGHVVEEIWEWLELSPYFMEQLKDQDSFFSKCKIMPCAQEKDITSNDVLFTLLSEINDKNVSIDYAINLINIVDSRRESRFPGEIMDKTFPMTILDSSDTYQESACNWYRKHHPKAPRTIFYTCAIWQAKPNEYFHKVGKDGKLSFQFYCGDSSIFPGVIGEEVPLTSWDKLDKDRIIDCPYELYELAKGNPDRFATEKCGRSLSTTGKWLNPTLVKPHLVLPMPEGMPDGDIRVSFADPNDSMIQFGFEDIVSLIPYDSATFVALDYATTGDKAGFCVGYIESMGYHEVLGEQVRDVRMRIPIVTSFGRFPGEETSAQKIIDLVMYIHGKRPIAEFSCDRHQSVPIKQALELQGINCTFRSIERDTATWNMFKNLLYSGSIKLPDNKIFYNELIHLIDFGDRIDHVDVADETGAGSNSKDSVDAVVRDVAAMFQAKEEMLSPASASPSRMDSMRDSAIQTMFDSNKLSMMMMATGMETGLNMNAIKNNRMMDPRFATGNIWGEDSNKNEPAKPKSVIYQEMLDKAREAGDLIMITSLKKKLDQALRDEGSATIIKTLVE